MLLHLLQQMLTEGEGIPKAIDVHVELKASQGHEQLPSPAEDLPRMSDHPDESDEKAE